VRALKNNPEKSKRGGARPGAGRPKGVPNKLTRTIKEAIEAAFEQVGGHEYLARMAEDQPTAFMALLGKAMPTQIDANVSTQPAFTIHDFIVPPEQQ
jgi:hypothetical protein